MSRLLKAIFVGVLCLGVPLVSAGVTVAAASPGRSPTASSGNFSCTTGRTGTYIVNKGHSTATPWEIAQATFSRGGKGIFVPSSLDLAIAGIDKTTGTVLFMTPEPFNTKGNGHAPAPNSCFITALVGTAHTTTSGITLVFMLEGTVTGRIVTNG